MRARPAARAGSEPTKPSVATSFSLPAGFRMAEDGLWFDRHESSGAQLASQFVCQRFDILALARTPQSDGWSIILRFRNPDGAEITRSFSKSLLAGDGADLRRALLDQGFHLSASPAARSRLTQVLNEATTEQRALIAASTGWVDQSFVLPDETLGASGAQPVFLRSRPIGAHYSKRGSFDGWRREIADRAVGNALLMLSLSLGFAPTLLHQLQAEGGVFHIRGASTTGKTTLARAAGSIWGGGGSLGFGQTWRGTSNSLEMMLAAHSDTLIVLDELKQSDPSEIGQVVYGVTTGVAKGRLNAAAELKARPSWRTIALSTGELSLKEHMRGAASRGQVFAGQELRFLDIEADGGRGLGVWCELHGASSPKAFADALNAACDAHYGWAGPAFVRELIARGRHAIDLARILRTEFERRVARPDDSAQVSRAAARFGLVAAAGELAAKFGIVNWPDGAAMEACQVLFEKWAAGFGRSGSHEDREVLRRIVDAIEKHGGSHFAPHRCKEPDKIERSASLEQWGWREQTDGEVLYHLTSSGFQVVFQGIDHSYAARTLAARGALVRPNEKGRFQRKISVNGQKHNVYTIRSSVTELLGE